MRGSFQEWHFKNSFIPVVSFWISLCLVFFSSSKFHYHMGRSGKAIPQVLLRWCLRDEAYIYDYNKIEEWWTSPRFHPEIPGHQKPMLHLISQRYPVSWIGFSRTLTSHIKEKFSSQEFDSLSHLAQRLSNVEVCVQNSRGNTFQKKVNNVEYSSDSEDENEIGLAEWTRNKRPVSCPFAKKDTKKYGFDVTKADRIFDCCCRKGKSSYLLIIRSHRPRS
jgi:hypothetical protein